MGFESVPTVAVLYVGDLSRVRRFYEGAFGWSGVDEGPRWCGLRSRAGVVTLVETAEARVQIDPASRRSATAIKLVIDVDNIADTIRAVVDFGGRADPSDRAWTFRGQLHRDVIDPEGNVLQLVQRAA
ncbi:MAG: hypothetical protein PGN29_08695 [Gordonia paraffinivorans]